MDQLLFVVSTVCCIFYIIKCLSIVSSNEMKVPIPILHKFDVSFSNTYLYTPSFAYQIYFWGNKLNIFT